MFYLHTVNLCTRICKWLLLHVFLFVLHVYYMFAKMFLHRVYVSNTLHITNFWLVVYNSVMAFKPDPALNLDEFTVTSRDIRISP